MKNLVFAFAFLCSTSLIAQFSYYPDGSGIQSPSNTASGFTSTAMGYYTTASGDYSTAMGFVTTASGDASTAMGAGTVAQDYASTSIGNYNKIDETPNPSVFDSQNTVFVIGNGSGNNNRSNALEILFDGTTTITGNVTAPAFIGDGSQLTNIPTLMSFNENGFGIQTPFTTASGYKAFAVGASTTASGPISTAMGDFSTASGDFSTAMGNNTEASGDFSTAMGASTTASSSYSTASGGATTAEDYLSFVIGIHNKTDETPNPEYFSYQNTAFVIGNGGYDSEGNYVGTSDTFSNAFEVLFDGTTTIAGDLNINSDARLKANIISLGATLSKLLQIDGKTYTMKKDANHKMKIGLLAQDIEKVFPELVSETNDIKSVNYQGLVPVLINAMKEQDDKITKQQQEIERLKKQDAINKKQQQEIDELKAMVKALAKG